MSVAKQARLPSKKILAQTYRLVRQECERQKCERHQCEANSANANSAKETTVRTRQECECQKCECQQCDATSVRKKCDNSANRLFFLSFCSKHFLLWQRKNFFTQNDWYWFRIWTERKMNESQRKECARWPVVPLELTIFSVFLPDLCRHTFDLACAEKREGESRGLYKIHGWCGTGIYEGCKGSL